MLTVRTFPPHRAMEMVTPAPQAGFAVFAACCAGLSGIVFAIPHCALPGQRYSGESFDGQHLRDTLLQPTDEHKGLDPVGAEVGHAGNEKEKFESLELAFLGSLLPGIVHNLATPLSGVIGATQLLEMRIGEQERILAELERSVPTQLEALIQQHKKSCNNLDIMSRNARHLTELLQIIIRRFHRCAQDTPAPQSLFELVSNELQFLDANLTYKHKVRKRFDLSTEPLTVFAVYRHVVAVIDEFVLRALAAHDFSRGLVELSVVTNFDANWGTISMDARFFETEEEPLEAAAIELYLARVAENGGSYQMDRDRGQLAVTIKLPRKTPTT